jgi:ABC-type transporter Mla subunit MlaD
MQFEWPLTLLFGSGMIYYYVKHRYDSATPSILTTTGILCTFVGLLIGLFNFDSANITGSVPKMIEGIRIAAICSVTGMLLSILSKRSYHSRLKTVQEEQHASVDMLSAHLEKLVKVTNEQCQHINHLLLRMETLPADIKSITAQADIRSENLLKTLEDNHKEHIRTFNDFTEKVVDTSTGALVESLEQVVRDFNKEVNEQFGENFNLFNKALDKLLKWQEDYYQDIEEMQERFDRCLKGIEASDKALRSLGAEANTLVDIAQKLNALLDASEESRQFLNDNLEAFKSLAVEAKEAFPLIEENIHLLTSELKTQVTTSVKQINDAVESQQHAFSGMIASFKKIEDNAVSHTNTIFNILNTRVAEQNERIIRQTEEAVTSLSKHLEDQVGFLDKALEEELTKSLRSLGDNLAQLSQKFVNDYGPLTDQLRQVVHLSQRINNSAQTAVG